MMSGCLGKDCRSYVQHINRTHACKAGDFILETLKHLSGNPGVTEIVPMFCIPNLKGGLALGNV